MKITLIADGRSPITRSWIAGLSQIGHQIDLISSYPCEKPEGVKDLFILPLAFSQVSRKSGSGTTLSSTSSLIQKSRLQLLKLRSLIGPLSVDLVRRKYVELLQTSRPDLVQALRIPFEGMLAAYTPVEIPVVLNSWGNDFTLHAVSSPLMRAYTRKAVQRANGFSADCQRDIRLAQEWGLSPNIPTLFAPGNGGLDLHRITQIREQNWNSMQNRTQTEVVINPRGIRPAYVRNDIFFQSLPSVLAHKPTAQVFCSAMAGQTEAEGYLQRYQLQGKVTLLENESQPELWTRYTWCNVLVSPAIHDGTPNSLLEGMAFGCLPVAGKIESIQEWITDGENGILVDPDDPKSVADGMIHGLSDHQLQQQAARLNWNLIQVRADRVKVMQQVGGFFAKLK